MKSKLFLWIFIIVLIIGGIIWLVARSGGESSPDETTASIMAASELDWTKGSNEAKVILIEYSDFQCPACAAYFPMVKQLGEDFETDLQIVYRHFPLRQIHDKAELAALSSEAAGKQGKFWEMHDLIFKNQIAWSKQRKGKAKEIFISYAERLELDVEQFQNDLDSKELREEVDNDYKSGLRAKVNGTPTFFLNGEKLQNPRSYENFRAIIEQAIGSKP